MNAVRQADEAFQGYELHWPRYDYEILTKPRGTVRTPWKLKSGLEWPLGGVFIPKGSDMPTNPEPEPSNWYNPMDLADKIILDVQRVSTDDPRSLLSFVNKWGVLGVGIPDDEDLPFDGVALTGQVLSYLKSWVEGLRSLQRREKAPMTYAGLAWDLNGMLSRIHPALRPTERGFVPIYKVPSLRDALVLHIWEMGTQGKQLRRCPECLALFIPGRTNQKFCSHLCANRPTVRRAKQKMKRKMRSRNVE